METKPLGGLAALERAMQSKKGKLARLGNKSYKELYQETIGNKYAKKY